MQRTVMLVVAVLVWMGLGAAAQQPFALGLHIGRFWAPAAAQEGSEQIPGLAMIGGGLAIGLTPALSLAIDYSRASISLLGFELLGLSIFDLVLTLDLLPRQVFGFFLSGGGGYLAASALGTGAGGLYLLAGGGVRISPVESVRLFLRYRARMREGLISAVEGGFSLSF